MTLCALTRGNQQSSSAFDTFPSLIHRGRVAALIMIFLLYNRRTLGFATMSNKFALSDIKRFAPLHASVVLVSWVDSAEIASLVEEIST